MKSLQLKRTGTVFLFLFLLGAAISATDVWRLVDGSSRYPGRECEVAGVARNYYREGMSLLYPRTDWRGDGPGFVEMEFPLYPWLIALFYKIIGYHEVIGRLLTYCFYLLSLIVFFQLSRSLLTPLGAIVACLFFVIHPLLFRISTSFQTEGLLLFSYLFGVYMFLRWIDSGSLLNYLGAILGTALAVLEKATAAHIGFFFLAVILSERGLATLRSSRVWLFGALCLLPAFLWYSHAYHLWLRYGNSLGVSNVKHFAGWDLFTDASIIRGIVALEIHEVWTGAGLILAALNLFFRRSERVFKVLTYWLLSLCVFYLVAGRTTSSGWAYYYHLFSVPVAALFIGRGAEMLGQLEFHRRFLAILIGITITFCAALGILGLLGVPGVRSKSLILGISVLFLFCLFTNHPAISGRNVIGKSHPKLGTVLLFLAVISLSATYFFEIYRLIRLRNPSFNKVEYECARDFSSYIPENVLIVASGDDSRDRYGLLTAHELSSTFYWVDRKGFSVSTEEQSVDKMQFFIRRGAEYFIAKKSSLDRKPGLENEMKSNFHVIKECDGYLLFDLWAQ